MASLQQATSRLLTRVSPRSIVHPTYTRHLFSKSVPPTRSSLRTGVYATVFAVSAGLFAVYYFDARSALHRYVLTPVVRYAFDPETGHKLAVKVLQSGLAPRDPVSDDLRLRIKIWDGDVTNPVGVAAGFDKDGEGIDGLFNLGFSWVEIGSVTPKPQPGNPRPRVFHLPEDGGLINRYGFPSQGHAAMLSRLRARIPAFNEPGVNHASLRDGALLAVNLGKNKDSPADAVDDYVLGVKTLGPYADVLVVNVSTVIQGLQNRDLLEKLLKSVTQARDELPTSARKPKLVLKIAPDLDDNQITDIADVIKKSKIDGVVRPAYLINHNKHEQGGLSGRPVKPYSLKALGALRRELPASILLFGCGGINTGVDALDYAKAGASMVQVYTGRIKDELVEELAKEGKTWSEVVHESIERLSLKEIPPVKKPKAGESTVIQLISEAKELHELLDKLGRRMEEYLQRLPHKVEVLFNTCAHCCT
ncbi:hypothetical protein BDQ17DRAFT_1389554 [Cyathus striatus]|nr:hypothetical protein BDQ17DRAFT_1389554 [Cyathus striatus]